MVDLFKDIFSDLHNNPLEVPTDLWFSYELNKKSFSGFWLSGLWLSGFWLRASSESFENVLFEMRGQEERTRGEDKRRGREERTRGEYKRRGQEERTRGEDERRGREERTRGTEEMRGEDKRRGQEEQKK